MISVHGPETMMTPHVKDHAQRPSTPETLPGTVSSCSLEDIATNLALAEEREQQEQQQQQLSPMANAPSSVCQQRKLSAAIVTNSESSHDYAAGRPVVTVEDLTISANNTSDSNNSNNGGDFSAARTETLVFDTPPPKPKNPKHQRGTSTCSSIPRRNHRDETGGSSSSLHKSLTRQTSAPSHMNYGALLNDPHPMRVDGWGEAPATHYEVRGSSYLSNKVKEPSEEALFSLLTVDIVRTADDKPILAGLCNHPDERIQRAVRREKATGEKELPEFVWAINLAVPGPPFYHVMLYFGCDDLEALHDTSTPLGRLTKPFFFGANDDFRDNTFKLIPRIVEGNYIVKKAVGTKPAILGRKLKQHYIRNPRFMELIVDISSDSIAKNVTGLSVGYAKSLITDMVFLLEGNTKATLPERILGGVRFKHIDFKKRDGKRVVNNYRA